MKLDWTITFDFVVQVVTNAMPVVFVGVVLKTNKRYDYPIVEVTLIG